MKISKIASLCKRNKHLDTYVDRNGQQWIGNGVAMYCVQGITPMKENDLLSIFEVPERQRDFWTCSELGPMDGPLSEIDFQDEVQDDTVLVHGILSLNWRDKTYWLLQNENEIFAINRDYATPLIDEPDYLTYHKRPTKEGFVIAVKSGLFLKAIIAPAILHNTEAFMQEIQGVSALYARMALAPSMRFFDGFFKNIEENKENSEDEDSGYQQESL